MSGPKGVSAMVKPEDSMRSRMVSALDQSWSRRCCSRCSANSNISGGMDCSLGSGTMPRTRSTVVWKKVLIVSACLAERAFLASRGLRARMSSKMEAIADGALKSSSILAVNLSAQDFNISSRVGFSLPVAFVSRAKKSAIRSMATEDWLIKVSFSEEKASGER